MVKIVQDLAEPTVTENALRVLTARYLIRDKEGNIIETPKELYNRVAIAAANNEKKEIKEDLAEKFYNMMARCDFIPNTPCLMNAGKNDGSLFACFVLPIEDSMESIFTTLKDAAMIHKTGGGTGFSFSNLRPRDSIVNSTHGVSSGPVSFMTVYNGATEAVKQGGKRRGANMGVLRIDHPDVMEFINCKRDTSKITNFNISLAITDEFINAFKNEEEYDLINPKDSSTTKMSAKAVMDALVENAHATGEPGVLFIDTINNASPTSGYEHIDATNPCGEQPLPPYDSCILGSINLGNMVLEKHYGLIEGNWEDQIDWDRLMIVTGLAVRFLDNLIDENHYVIPEIEKQTKGNRRIGLGVMGFADLLIRLGIPYDSEIALEIGTRIMYEINKTAIKASEQLSEEKGTFPNWDISEWAISGQKLRNATLTTIAPTGSICIIAGCSSGIEPHFAIIYEKNVLGGQKLLEINPDFKEACSKYGISDDIFERIVEKIKTEKSLCNITELPEEIRTIFKTTDDISYEQHILMQSAFQKNCQAGVSKTINMPSNATKEDVQNAYLMAHRLNCKGITVYRDGSRPNQVLDIKKKSRMTPMAADRPQMLHGFTDRIATGYGNLYVTINEKDGRPFEVFASIGKSSYTTMADAEAISRLITLCFKYGIPIHKVIKQLSGIGGSAPVLSKEGLIGSIPDALAKVIMRHYPTDIEIDVDMGHLCGTCGSKLVANSGCWSCPNCGNGRCG